ncbi:MAG: PBP1A family penicillin-binding protein [Deltaproteobacteria bacterium]|nr:PBP1A family penicillin-binding protein [Deltaproteobacteria bacterium]
MATLLAVFVGTIFVAGLAGYLYFAGDLPNIQTVSDYHPYLVSKVFGSDGTQIGEFWNEERRELVPVEEIPPLLISSFIAAEDSRFFEHHGIDFRGTLRAFLANLKSGGVVQGGSTITQQVTRSLLLSRQRSYARKVREAILATRLERYLTKDQILYLYLNQIYFGNRAYGVKSAAWDYFHKDLKDLNLSEMTILASLPRAPELYSPLRHPEKTRERQEYVLQRLMDEKIITEKNRKDAMAQELTLYVEGTDKDRNLKVAPHFLENLRSMLLKKYGEEKLYYGGLKINTPLDPTMQKAAVTAVRRGLEVLDRRRNGWRGTFDHVDFASIDAEKEKLHMEILKEQSKKFVKYPPVKTKETRIEEGEIYPAVVTGFEGQNTLVYVGFTSGIVPRKDISFDQTKLAYEENLYLNDPPHTLKLGDLIHVRAMGENKFSFYQDPVVQGALYAQETSTGFIKAMVGGYDFSKSEFNRTMDALRQPGSSFKPFIYAAALDKGFTMKTPVADSPFTIPVGDEVWSPKNYDGKYRGMTTFHNAITHSYNVATARIAYHIHLHYLTAYIRKMRLTTPIFKYPSMALGANGVHLMEMVAAYATFPNLGVYRPPVFVTKISDQEGNVLEEYQLPQSSVETPNTVAKEIELIRQKDDLNKNLFEANQVFIEQDQLKLSPAELKILYGKNIPEGHVMTPQTAYLMVKMMENVVQQGTGQRVKKLGKPVAGKTGTTNDETDTWFVGYVPDLAAGVWVGYDAIRTLGKGEQGGRTAAPIFLDFMQSATQNWEAKDFTMPDEVKGKDLFALPGGSSRFADSPPPAAIIEGGSSQDRSADFMEADMEKGAPPPPEPVKEEDAGPSEEAY